MDIWSLGNIDIDVKRIKLWQLLNQFKIWQMVVTGPFSKEVNHIKHYFTRKTLNTLQ